MFAELPDGTRLEFPDGTDPAVMDRVVRQNLAGAGRPAAAPAEPVSGEGSPGMIAGLGRGFTGAVKELGPTAGAGIEAAGIATGIPAVERAGTRVREMTESETPTPDLVRLRDFFQKPFTFIGEQIGAGVGSTLPSLVGGAAGAGLGALTGPAAPIAAPALTIAGAGATALLQNAGDLFRQLQEEGVDRKRAAEVASIWGPVLTVPDVFSASRLLKPFLGTAVTDLSTKGIARAIATRMREGATVEGLTELGQNVGQEAIAAIETGKPNLAERAERVATGAIAGGLTGGVTGAGGAAIERARGPRPQQEPPPPAAGGPQESAEPIPPPQGTPPVGTVLGLAEGDSAPFRAQVDGYSDDGRFVFLRDEDGERITVRAADLPGMAQTAPPPSGRPGDPTAVPTPPEEETPPPSEDEARFYDQFEAESMPPRPAPPAPPTPQLDLGDPSRGDAMLRGALRQKVEIQTAVDEGRLDPEVGARRLRALDDVVAEAEQRLARVAARPARPDAASVAAAAQVRDAESAGDLGAASQQRLLIQPTASSEQKIQYGKRRESANVLPDVEAQIKEIVGPDAETSGILQAVNDRRYAAARGNLYFANDGGFAYIDADNTIRFNEFGERIDGDVDAAAMAAARDLEARQRAGALGQQAGAPRPVETPDQASIEAARKVGAREEMARMQAPPRAAKAAPVSAKKPRPPQTFLEFLSEVGIREGDPEIADLGETDLLRNWHKDKRFRKKIIRPDGMTVQQAIAEAERRGFIGTNLGGRGMGAAETAGEAQQQYSTASTDEAREAIYEEGVRLRPVVAAKDREAQADLLAQQAAVEDAKEFAARYGNDADAELRRRAELLGVETWDTADAADLQEQINERLAIMEVDTVEQALVAMATVDTPGLAPEGYANDFDLTDDIAQEGAAVAERAGTRAEAVAEEPGPEVGPEDRADAERALAPTGERRVDTDQRARYDRIAEQVRREQLGIPDEALREEVLDRMAEPEAEATNQGQQFLAPGVAPVSDRERAEAQAAKPLRGEKAQKAADEGLFDEGARRQQDLLSTPPKPLTERQFKNRYWKHVDLRAREDGKGADRLSSIMRDGFKQGIGPNLTMASDNSGQYKARVGDLVYLVDSKKDIQDTPNGPKIRSGWRPAPYEVLQIVGNKSIYQQYLEAWEKALSTPPKPRPVKQTATEAFKRWFGNSKVVDENGDPLVVYHGTVADIEKFEPLAFFGDAETANTYANDRGLGGRPATVYPVYLSIKNPATEADIEKVAESIGVWTDTIPIWEFLSPSQNDLHKKMVPALKANGFDGAIIENDYSMDDPFSPVRSYVAFEPEQIKSAVGNSGAFDPANPRMQAMRRPRKRLSAEQMAAQNARILAAATNQLAGKINQAGITDAQLRASTSHTPPPAASVGPLRPMWRIGNLWTYVVQATAVAARDRAAARLFNANQGQHHLETYLIKDGGEKLDSVLRLNDKQAKVFNQIAEYLTLAGKRPKRVGKTLALRTEPVSITEDVKQEDGSIKQVKRTLTPELSKPGEVIEADEATTQAIYDALKYGDERWMALHGSLAQVNGYRGDFTRAGIDKALAEAKRPRDKLRAEMAKALFEAAEEGKRKAYFPLMRYGDTAIVVKPKPGAASNKMGGKPSVKDGGVFFVQSEGPLSGLFSGTATGRGRVQKRMEELKKRFPPDQYTMEAKYLQTAKDVEALDLPLIDRLMTATNLRDARQAAEAYKDALNLKTPEYEKALQELARALPGAARKQALDKLKAGLMREREAVPGYETDFRRALMDYNRSSSGIIARRIYRTPIEEAKISVFGGTDDDGNKVSAQSHPSVQKFAQRYLDYLDTPEHAAFRTGRWLGFYLNIFGSFGSAAVNGISTATITAPQIAAWSPAGAAGVVPAFRRALRGLSWGPQGFTIDYKKIPGTTPEEAAAIRQAALQGTLAPALGLEFQGTDVGSNIPGGPRLNKVLRQYSDIGSSLFNVVEQLNRYTAFIASYRAAQNPAARKRFERQYAKNERVQDIKRTEGLTPATIARFMVDQTQFIGGQFDRPSVLRGAGGVILQFKTFPLNYTRVLVENLTRQGWQGKFAAGLMLMGLFSFAGLLGLPFGQDALDIVEIANKALGGEDDDLEGAIREFIARIYGGERREGESEEAFKKRRENALIAAEVWMRGPTRQFLGFEGGTRFGVGEVGPEMGDIVQAVPLLAGTIGRVQEAQRRSASGQPVGAAVAATSPFIGKGPADVARGMIQYPAEGYQTQRGRQVIDPEDITYGQMALKAIGFQPAEMARKTEKAFAERRALTGDTQVRTDRISELGNLYSQAIKAQEAGDEKRAQRLFDKVGTRLEEFAREHAEGRGPPPPDRAAIRQRALENLEPELRIRRGPKERRERALEVPYVD